MKKDERKNKYVAIKTYKKHVDDKFFEVDLRMVETGEIIRCVFGTSRAESVCR